MILILAEKPSVGRALSSVVGANKTNKGYIEGGGYIVSWCVGHLVGLKNPNEYGCEWEQKWSFSQLPMIPEAWQFKVTESTKEQFGIVKALMGRDDVTEIICATDADREGECIFRYVYNMARCRKPVKRLWVSSLEESAIRQALVNMKPMSAYDNLFYAGFSRAKADWIVGMNGSRLFSCRYGGKLNIGRVQTPTLAMLVKCDYDVKHFVKQKYFTADIACDDFTLSSARMDDENAVNDLISSCEGKPVTVKAVKKEVTTVSAPKLYDLTTLQREANKTYGYTAQQTLDYTQNLYEKKLVTYPRTDSQFLSDDMKQTALDLLRLCNTYLGFNMVHTPDLRKVINNKKVTGHHAIIPTSGIATADLDGLPAGEKNILVLVARKLICASAPAHKYEAVKVTAECNGTEFTASGKTVLDMGWKRYAVKSADDKEDDKSLPVLTEGQVLTGSLSKGEHFTSPPKPYTEDTLLYAMEHAGQDEYDEDRLSADTHDIEKKGLGTPATRAAVIESLVKNGYAERKGKQIIPTDRGIDLVSVEEIGQAFLDRTHEEFEDLAFWWVRDDMRDAVPDISDEKIAELLTAFDGAALHGWEAGDNQPKINRIKKALHDILGDETQTEKAFAIIAKEKYSVSFEPERKPDSLEFQFGYSKDGNDRWFTESGLLSDFAEEHDEISFSLANALMEYLDDKQHKERMIPDLNAGYYKKTNFEIRAVVDGQEFNFSNRFDIGDGKGSGGGSLIDHIRTICENAVASTAYPYNTPESKETPRNMLNVLVPYLEAHSALTAEEQKILDDFKEKNPIRTIDDVEKAQGTFKIYQLPSGQKYHGVRFEDMEQLKKDGVQLNHDDYELVYEGEVGEFRGKATLEALYTQFNTNHPEDFRGHSLSVSDVIVISVDDKDTAYYCDSFGFTEMPEFFLEKEKAQEKSAPSVADLEVGDIIMYDGARREIEEISTDRIKMKDLDAPDYGGILLGTSDVLAYDGWQEDMESKGFEIISKAEKPAPAVDTPEQAEPEDKGPVSIRKVGDFYEMYGKNAEIGEEVLGLRMLSKNGQPMVGFPDHVKDEYSAKLREAGYTVLIEQAFELNPPKREAEKLQTLQQVVDKFFGTDCESAETEGGTWKLAIAVGEKVGELFYGGEPVCGIYNRVDKMEIEPYRELTTFPALLRTAMLEHNPDKPVEIMDFQRTFETPLDKAKWLINDFCEAEYREGADFSDLHNVGLAFTTLTDDELPIQVTADLIDFKITHEFDGEVYNTEQYDSIEQMIENGLTDLDFSDLVSVPDEVIERHTGKDEQTVELMSDAADVADISSPADDVPAVTLKYKGDAESLDEIKDKALFLGATVIVDNAEGVISIDTYADHKNELDNLAYELGVMSVDDVPVSDVPDKETEEIDDDAPLFADDDVIEQIQADEKADIPFWEKPDIEGEQLSLFGDPEPIQTKTPDKAKSEFAPGPVVDGVQVFEALAAEIDRGTGFVNGKIRVQEFYEKSKGQPNHPTIQELADFLKKEYGIGGHSGEGNISLVDYDSKGMTFSFENGEKFRHSWHDVAVMTESRLRDNTYLSPEQQEQWQAMKAERSAEENFEPYKVEIGDKFRNKATGVVSEVVSLTGALPYYTDDCTVKRLSGAFEITENISYDKLLNSGLYEYIGRNEPEKEQSAPVKPDKPAVNSETEKPEIPTVKNLNQLKKSLKPGMMFEITDHLRSECIGERRIVTGVSTVDFTSRKLDENGAPTGKDIHMEFDRAKNWTFDGGELTSRLDNGDMLMSFHFIDSLERTKEPEIAPETTSPELSVGDYLEYKGKEYKVESLKENGFITLNNTAFEGAIKDRVTFIADEFLSNGDFKVITPEKSVEEVTAPDKGENFTITDDALGEGGAKAKFRANVDAIRTLKTLEAEKRPATAEEKETLSRYVGWGAIPQAFDKSADKWSAEYKELSELLTPEEYRQARSTVGDAFYTSPTVIERQNGYKSVFK